MKTIQGFGSILTHAHRCLKMRDPVTHPKVITRFLRKASVLFFKYPKCEKQQISIFQINPDIHDTQIEDDVHLSIQLSMCMK
jgi:hypothetical protein